MSKKHPKITSDSKKIVKYVSQRVHPDSIILLHVMYDSQEESLESVKGIIKDLEGKGNRFSTVSEMVE